MALARAAAVIDRISGGRFVLGMGSGDMPAEFSQMGLPWQKASERQARLEESLRIAKPLLRGETVTYAGQHFQANGAVLTPPPMQQPHVPILVAGGGERTTLRFVAEYADASSLGAVSWAGGAFTPDDMRHKFSVLKRHREEIERPYDTILRTGLLSVFLSDSAPALAAKVASAGAAHSSVLRAASGHRHARRGRAARASVAGRRFPMRELHRPAVRYRIAATAC